MGLDSIGMRAGHWLPYAIWIGGMMLANILATGAAWIYAIKSGLVVATLAWLKPWRFYPRLTGTDWIWGLGIGVAVTLAWILPETPWVPDSLREVYNRWCILPIGAFPDYFPQAPTSDYEPTICGWWLTVAKLFGSAFAIPVAEELFFRGWLYRWIQGGNTWENSSAAYVSRAFWLVVLCFALEHDRVLAGALAGLAYGYLANVRGSLRSAILAHCTTNLLLGLYVILATDYRFW